MEQVAPDKAIELLYTNYRGDTARRRVVPKRIWFGETPWHPGSQWILEAFDLDREAERSFALIDIQGMTTLTGEIAGGVSHGRSA